MKKMLIFSIAFLATLICLPLPSASFSISPVLVSGSFLLSTPVYSEIDIPSLGSSINVNTNYTGKVIVAREIKTDGTTGRKYNFAFEQISDNWAKLNFEDPILSFDKIILLGTRGNLLLKKSAPNEGIIYYKNGTSTGRFVIRLGTANETIYFPDFEIQDLDSIDVGIVKENGEKLKGDVIVSSGRFIVVHFSGLNPDFVQNGKVNMVVRLRAKSYNLGLNSWGYEFDISRTENSKKYIVSNVYGLGPDKKLSLKYSSYKDQVIEPLAEMFTVKDLNGGREIAVIQDRNQPVKLDLILEDN